MKKYIRILSLLAALLLLLSGCGQPGFSPEEEIVTYPQYSYAPVEAEHGEDYVIGWEDAGMEAHIRSILNKPQGDILHSDVWDIQVLYIHGATETPRHFALTEPDGGAEVFDKTSSLTRDYITYDKKAMPAVESLRDLRHFDSLQILDVEFQYVAPGLKDLSGLEDCRHLRLIRISNADLESLALLAQMPQLEILDLRHCGSLDLTPLENLPSLTTLHLKECDILSLEPLTTLPALRHLHLGDESTYPSLEPLTRTTVETLDMGLSMSGRKMYKDLDYEPLTRMPNLIYLNLTNHRYVDVEVCEMILANSKTLIFLDIYQTTASKFIAWGFAKLDVSNLEGFYY